jgi:glycogen(starch) synthase
MPDCAVKRVLMTGDTVGGVWTFTLDLAEALGEKGVDVILAAMGGPLTDAQREEAAAIPNLRLMDAPYKLEWMNDPWRDVEESGRWVLGLEERFSPDIVHLNTYGHGALRFSAPVLMTAHSCVLSWWAAVKHEPIPAQWTRYRYEVENSVKAVDLLTAPSRAMLRMLEENYGPDLPATRVVPNGRFSDRFRGGSKEPLILTAGRLWDEAKNAIALARIAPALEWPVYIAGEDRHPDGSTAQLPKCHRLGRLSTRALAEWYSRAAIYALPARYEPFGLSILEAALSGCALVLGDIESLRENWQGDALFVPPDNLARLRSTLAELIAKPDLREELSRRSVARGRQLTSERMAHSYADAYSSLTATRRATCAS